MSYATYSDLCLAFGKAEVDELADRDRDGNADTGVIADALAFADDHIDGYLRGHYDLPLAIVPANLKGVACDLARYRLYQDQPTELVQNRYDVGCFFLKDVARGLVQLDIGTTATATLLARSQPAAVFSREPAFLDYY